MRPGAVFLCLLLFSASGCATSGNPAVQNEALANQIKIGVTTKEEVRRMFGQPTAVSRGSFSVAPGLNGAPSPATIVEAWTYSYAETDIHPATFIPIVGLFAGSATVKSASVTVSFDDKGVVQHISTAQAQATAGPGASTQ